MRKVESSWKAVAAIAVVLALGSSLPHHVNADTREQADRLAREAPEITRRLRSTAAQERTAAVASIQKWIEEDPGRVQGYLKDWMKLLMASKDYAAAVDLAGSSILSASGNLSTVENFQRVRVEALLAQGKSEEALVQARSLFNIASMRETGEALKLLDQCLAAADGGRERADKFRSQEMAGAKFDGDLAGSGPRSEVMDSIHLNAAYYQEAIQDTGDDWDGECARGNLLLLAGQAKEARAAFEEAYTMAPANKLVEASENIARAIKAEDGTIGRANAWVLSIRPHAQVVRPDADTPGSSIP